MTNLRSTAAATSPLDDHQVDSEAGLARDPQLVRWRRHQARRRTPKAGALRRIERLLGEAVVPRSALADLDQHEPLRRARVPRDDVDLIAPEAHVPAQQLPSSTRQGVGNERLSERPLRSAGRHRHSRLCRIHDRSLVRAVQRPRTGGFRDAAVFAMRLSSRPALDYESGSSGSGSWAGPIPTSPGASPQISSCSTSAHDAKVRRWAGVRPSVARAARCSGAA